ncbi:FMN-binding protein [Nonomuraea sp. H19]|uniref:FMN-binding protein n=1 Tax=Nonomuraea sp. H19 TaxID=3452206 RepID=UPI003F8B6E2B
MTALSRRITTVAGISIALAMAGCSTTDTDVESPPSVSNSGRVTSGPPSGRDSTYADGDYNATGQYGSLPSSIGVFVTLVDDVITDVEVTSHATNPTSREYQERFADAIPALVVGRNIDEVKVSRVAGSSGTPDGFNAAIQRIKSEASN